MALHLIEVPHSENKADCIRAIQVFLSSGSHFLTNADWGCEDGEHKAWIVVDVNNKEEALQIVTSSLSPSNKNCKVDQVFQRDNGTSGFTIP